MSQSPDESGTIQPSGGPVLRTQVKEAEMKRWDYYWRCCSRFRLFSFPESRRQRRLHTGRLPCAKGETIEVGDIPGHFVGFSETPGIIFMTKGPARGEIGTRKATTYFDIVNGKGSLIGYYVYKFPDGSAMHTKAIGTYTPVEGGKRSAFEGTFEVAGEREGSKE